MSRVISLLLHAAAWLALASLAGAQAPDSPFFVPQDDVLLTAAAGFLGTEILCKLVYYAMTLRSVARVE